MFHSLRARLFLNALAILAVGMSLAGFLFWKAAGQLYLDTQTENLLAQAKWTAAALAGQTLGEAQTQPYSQTSNVMPGIHSRVIAPEGAVVIDLSMLPAGGLLEAPAAENNAVTPEELLARPEIKDALLGRASSTVREVGPERRQVLYAAAPVSNLDGQVSGLVYLAAPLPQNGLPAGFLLQLGGISLAAVAMALLAGTWLAGEITRPVTAMTHSAEAVSQGDLMQNVPAKSGIKELDHLGWAFNQMVASLRQSEQAQNAFVADVAHELRTPLTVIKGTIETLEDGAMDDMEGRGPLLSSMQKETDRLIRLVNDLLVLTRADAGMLKLEFEALDLAELARQRCEHLRPLAARRGVRFVIQAEGDLCVSGDADRLSQVLDNLLDNALRYSPDGSAVTVMLTQQAQQCCCQVRDCGPGVAEKHLSHLFERFYRVEPARQRKGGGAGLGLSIAQALVAAHGGRIWAESQPGSGTAIFFCLPCVPNCHEAD
ncbi:MAG TPA: ATP-binding protein [Anaerolineaceae bacterium]|nr:ATP-binding protein [Anaerolineaceae bacterium]HPN50220.1 ATP-binding protein [Anaerolineaceae bacterium]